MVWPFFIGGEMKNDGKTLVVKCHNRSVHNTQGKEPGEGNILFVARGNSIFIKCGNHHCKRWNRIKISIPGVNLNFSNAAFLQAKMPKGYHFDTTKATVVIEDDS